MVKGKGSGLVVSPREVLKNARSAANAGDYQVALANYERFFDHALQDQGPENNFYGVRLSYCLDEWARLGEKYPPARQRLEEKARDALAAFEATRDPERFHDFQSIRDHLGQSDSVLTQFDAYHRSSPDLAGLALRFMWNRLVEARRWDICAGYLADAESKYQTALFKFERSMEVCAEDPSLGGEEFAEQIKGWYVRDVGNLLSALKNSGRADEAARLEAIVTADMQSRGHPDLIFRIADRVVL